MMVLVRDKEGASQSAVAAAHTPFLVNMDKTFVRLEYGIGGTDYGTTGILAVHTCPASKEPGEFTVSFGLYEAHLDPGLGGELFRVFIGAPVGGLFGFMFVPALTSYLACPAGGALGAVIKYSFTH